MPELGPLYDPNTYVSGAPLEALDRLREAQPVVWVDEAPYGGWPGGRGFWLVLRHEEVRQVLGQPQLFSSWLGGTQLRDPARAKDLEYVRAMMLNQDPPAHRRLRRLVSDAFTAKALARLEVKIDEHARRLVEDMIAGNEDGKSDFVQDLARHLPVLVLADILGMPCEDRWLNYDWSNRVIGFQDPEYAVSDIFSQFEGSPLAQEALRLRPRPGSDGHMPDPRTREGIPDLYRYAHLLAEEKRRNPSGDIVSLLLGPVDGGQGLSIEEFENMFWLFSVAGNETLRNGLPGGLVGLLSGPEGWTKLRTTPKSELATVVDEMLRWWTPVMNFRRTANKAVELGGASIRAGDKVVVSFLAANRDPRAFIEPQRFIFGRSPNPHLAFGYGPHFCLGAQLARRQMASLFFELGQRIEVLKLDGQPDLLRSNFQRGVKRLPVRWRQVRAAGRP